MIETRREAVRPELRIDTINVLRSDIPAATHVHYSATPEDVLELG
jgi:hypothetical protein